MRQLNISFLYGKLILGPIYTEYLPTGLSAHYILPLNIGRLQPNYTNNNNNTQDLQLRAESLFDQISKTSNLIES